MSLDVQVQNTKLYRVLYSPLLSSKQASVNRVNSRGHPSVEKRQEQKLDRAHRSSEACHLSPRSEGMTEFNEKISASLSYVF